MGKHALALFAFVAATFFIASCDLLVDGPGAEDENEDDPQMAVSLSVSIVDAEGSLGGTDPTPSAVGKTVYLGLSKSDSEDVQIAKAKFTYADSAGVALVDAVESSSNFDETFVFTEAGSYTLTILVDIDGNFEKANDAGKQPYGDYYKKATLTVAEGDEAKSLSFTLGTDVSRTAVPWTGTSWYAANADLGNGQIVNIRLIRPTTDTFEFWIVDDEDDTDPNDYSLKGTIENIADSGLADGGLTRFQYATDTTHIYYNGAWRVDDGTTLDGGGDPIEPDPSDYFYTREAGESYTVFRLDQERNGYVEDGVNGDTTISFVKVASF